MAAVSYGNDAKLDFDLDDHLNERDMLEAVNRIKYRGGNTNTTGGLREMRLNVFSAKGGDRKNVPDMCILITDGVPTREVGAMSSPVERHVVWAFFSVIAMLFVRNAFFRRTYSFVSCLNIQSLCLFILIII